jgi:acyl carrier protein
MEQPASLHNDEVTSPKQMSDTFERVRELLHERYGVAKSKIEMDAELSSLGLDSLSLVECAFDLEKHLNLSLADLPHELITVRDLVRYVDDVRRRPVNPKAASPKTPTSQTAAGTPKAA